MVESTTGHDAIAAFAAPADQLLRPARALLGWLPDEIALRLLNGKRADAQPTNEQRAAAALARQAVASRAEGIVQDGVIREIEQGVLDEHIERLRGLPAAAPYFGEGYRVALVDLTRVCAFQPSVFIDSATDRVGAPDPGDLDALARIYLPTEWHVDQHAQLDEGRNTWMLISRNPNLKVLGPFATGVGDPPVQGLGFGVSVTPWIASNCRTKARSARHASAGSILGRPPACLARLYSDSAVSAAIEIPASQKMVVVQALELSPRG